MTDPADRTSEQQDVVSWMKAAMNRRAEVISTNAGWEYLKWAGYASAVDPKPSQADILTALDRFDSGSLLPVNYRHGQPDATSNSGFCAYVPPAGLDKEYAGAPSSPGSSADTWCYPPFQCIDPLGCENNQPSFESFVRWGEADLIGNPNKDVDFALNANGVARGIAFGGAAVGAGITGLAVGAALYFGPPAVLSAVAAGIQPFLAGAVLADFTLVTAGGAAGGTAAAVGNGAAGLVIGAGVGFAAAVAVVAIAIAVLKGIQVAAASAVPGQLRDAITHAVSGAPDLQEMVQNPSDLSALYSLFIRATGPGVKAGFCDNDADPVFGDTVVIPCANQPAIPAASADDPQFLIQPTDADGEPTGPATRSDTVDVIDTVLSPYPDLRIVGETFTHRLRMRDTWFVTDTTVPAGGSLPQFQSTRLNYLQPGGSPPVTATAWLRHESDGSYRFLNVLEGSEINPASCEASGTCALMDWIPVILPGPHGYQDSTRARLSVVPRLRPTLAITQATDAIVGQPVTLTASNTGADVGSLTYQWYLKPAGGLAVVCPPAEPYCGHDGPFTGSQVTYTWQGSGSYEAVVVATDAHGVETTAKKTITVTGTGPRLSIFFFGEGQVDAMTQWDGTIRHAGAADIHTVTVDWGDGTVQSTRYDPASGFICPESGCVSFKPGVRDRARLHRHAHVQRRGRLPRSRLGGRPGGQGRPEGVQLHRHQGLPRRQHADHRGQDLRRPGLLALRHHSNRQPVRRTRAADGPDSGRVHGVRRD